MVNFSAIGILFGILLIAGFILAIIISTIQCGKQDYWVSFKEGFWWSLWPTLTYLLLQYSMFMKSIFTEGTKSLFSWTGMVTSDEGYNTLGLCYALILVGLVVSTRMIHILDTAICKPDIQELSNWSYDFIQKQKAKLEEQNNNQDVNGGNPV